MPNTTLMAKGPVVPGTTTTDAITAPPVGTRGHVAAVLDEDRVAAPGLRLTLSTEVSTDHGASYHSNTTVVWDSGPANAPQAVGMPRPRPITGLIAVDARHTNLRCKVVVDLSDDTTTTDLGLEYVTLDP